MNDTIKPEHDAAQPSPANACSVDDIAKRIPFRMVMHMNCGKEHHLDFLNKDLNIVCLITTPYRHGKPGKGVKQFSLNERTAKPYKTLSDLLKANPTIAQRAAKMYPPNISDERTPTERQRSTNDTR